MKDRNDDELETVLGLGEMTESDDSMERECDPFKDLQGQVDVLASDAGKMGAEITRTLVAVSRMAKMQADGMEGLNALLSRLEALERKVSQ